MKTNEKMITPVFLVGARRSGTTLFRVMLNGHPDVSWDRGWEFATGFIDNHGSVLKTFDDVKPEKYETSSIAEVRDYLNEKALTALGQKKILGATIHVGFKKIPHLYKNAKYIHIVRDPRDIAISSLKLGWSGSYYYAPDIWITAEKEWEELKAIIDESAWMELRYEDFVTHPEAQLKRICKFTGIAYTEKLFDYINTTSYSYPKKSLAYRWKKQLQEYDVQLIEARIGDYLHQSGYLPSSYTQLKISSLKTLELNIRNYAGIKGRNLAEEGFWLYMMGALGRKLRLKSLAGLHKNRLQEKKKRHLKKLEKNY